ncbi:MAG: hypothetical protein ACXWWQ_06525 [Candidatus Limnocylindria bacterium]
MTSTARPVLLMLLGALALAAPVSWFIGEYLGDFGVPIEARVGIGLLMIPAMFALTLVGTSAAWGLRERQRSRAELQAVTGGDGKARPDLTDIHAQMQELERSPLTRVMGIGRVVESDGITVEFLALELRGRGGAITLRAHGRSFASGPGLLEWPTLSISDDLGTEYVVMPAGGGGGEDSMQFELRFAPAPPAATRTLDVAIVEFSPTTWPFGRATESAVEGQSAPWRVTVDLR